MRGFPKALQNEGGMVRGPGTATSDSVPGNLPEGSYVMPADSARQMGADVLAGMGRGFKPGKKAAKVPVALSAGEQVMPPEQVHAVGVQALDGLRAATHRPVAAGFPMDSEQRRVFLANGGLVTDDDRQRRYAAAQDASWNDMKNAIGSAWGATKNAAKSAFDTVTSVQDTVGRTAADVVNAPGRALAGVIDKGIGVARGFGANMDYLRPRMTPGGADPGSMTPYLDLKVNKPPAPMTISPDEVAAARARSQAIMAARQGADAPARPAAQVEPPAAPAIQAAAPAAKGFAPAARALGAQGSEPARSPDDWRMAMPTPNQGVSSGAAAAQRVADIYKSMAYGDQGGQTPAAPAVPRIAHSGNSWKAENDLRNARVGASGMLNNMDRQRYKNGQTPAQMQYAAMLQADNAARAADAGLQQEGLRQAGGFQTAAMRAQGDLQREQIRQAGDLQRAQMGTDLAHSRLGLDERRLGLDAQRLSAEQQENGLRQGQEEMKLMAAHALRQAQQRAINAKTPQERQEALFNMRILSGQDPQEAAAKAKDRYLVVGGGQEDIGQGALRTLPQRLFDAQTGRFVDGPAALPKPSENHVRYLRSNPQQAAWFDETYGPGAAERVLKG